MRRETTQAFVFPNPVALVTVADGADKANIITLAWVGMACSDPVSVSIAIRPSRYSHELLADTGELTLNIPGEDLLEATDLCGTVSGRDVDKWREAGLTPEPATKVGAPLIVECPYALECRVVETLSLGAHDLFVGKVLAAHADEDVLDEKGGVRYDRLRPLSYLPYDYYSIGERVYGYGESRKRT
jgi:flavin reductase (DIM6/NTAB) family NADH-FMN oxidoreductase RutF